MKRTFDLRIASGVLLAAIATACVWHALAPRTYVASARLVLPDRIVRLESAALDPAAARSNLSSQLAGYRNVPMLDAPMLLAARRSLPLDLALGTGLGLAFGGGLTFWRLRRRRPVRAERELIPLLGDPL